MFKTPLQLLEDTIPFFSKEKYEDNKFHYYNLNEYIQLYYYQFFKVLFFASPLTAIIPWYFFNFHYLACLIFTGLFTLLLGFGLAFSAMWISFGLTFIDDLMSLFTFGLSRYILPPLPFSLNINTVRHWLLITKYSKEYLKYNHFYDYEIHYIYGKGRPPKYALPSSVYNSYMRG